MSIRYRTRQTGLHRLRPTLFGKWVLQVQEVRESNSGCPPCPPPPGCPDRGAWKKSQEAEFERTWRTMETRWRDARTGDLPEINVMLRSE